MSGVDMSAEHSLADYLSVSEAAKYLGVSSSTLRNWDHSGTFPATRHPINNYRLYRKSDLEDLLATLRHSTEDVYVRDGK